MHFKCINAGFGFFVFVLFFYYSFLVDLCLFVGVFTYANEYL